MSDTNGKSRIIIGLIGFVQTIGIAFFFWAGSNIVDLRAENAAIKATISALQSSINRIEDAMKEDRKASRMRVRPNVDLQ